MMNAETSNHKQSNVEREVNKLILIIFAIEITISFILLGFAFWWNLGKADDHKYLGDFERSTLVTNSILSFFTYYLLLNTMIPTSLIVTLEVVKVV